MKITDLKCGLIGKNPIVRIVTDEGPEQAHFLLHQRALVAVGKHRV